MLNLLFFYFSFTFLYIILRIFHGFPAKKTLFLHISTICNIQVQLVLQFFQRSESAFRAPEAL